MEVRFCSGEKNSLPQSALSRVQLTCSKISSDPATIVYEFLTVVFL
jgi:hypothetical protein